MPLPTESKPAMQLSLLARGLRRRIAPVVISGPYTGTLYSFGLPGNDEIDRMGSGDE